jgi:ABC-2 type transport system ATP-binding protein
VLELIELAPRQKDRVEKLSGGLKRRVNFGCGIVHDPEVLLLDEPTVGVDPQTRARLLDLVVELARAGACVLYTTHYMEEAERLCDRLAILDQGRIIAAGTMPELRALVGERDVLRLSGEFAAAAVGEALRGLEGIEIVQADPDALTLTMPQASGRLPDVFAALGRAGARVQETTLTRPSLESLFIKLTGKGIRE